MGCGDSMVVPQRGLPGNQTQNYQNNSSSMFYQMQNAKRPKFLNAQLLNQFQKDALWAIIQRNSLKQFAYYIENEKLPSNVQVGPANTFWNFAHFCARWDAFECLHYIIKRIYAENANLLRSLMNQQTIEGYTAMHVIIEWNAINCFYLILDCGGVDLSYKDKNNTDVYAKAFLFKRTQMLQVLEKFRANKAEMVIVQSETSRGFKDFSQLIVSGQIQNRKQYRMTNQRMDYIIDTRNRLERPPPPYVPPVQNNPNKYQELNNKMKEIEAKKKPNTSTEGNEGNEGAEDINVQKILQQRRFREEQERIKEQQRQSYKKSIEIQRQEEQRRLRAQMQQNVNQQRVYEQAELTRIQKQKEIIRRNIQAMQSNQYSEQRNFTGTKMVCPEDIKPLYQAALSKGTKFVDTQFPADQTSLGNPQQYRFGWDDCVWLRPQQMFPGGNFEVFDGIQPDDVKQGALSVCYYLALLSSIAQNQQRIKKIFKFYDKDLGFYALQLYLEGKPITMIVDDQIPCMKGTNEPLFAKPRTAETWVMIFEKAWVKMFGSYLASEKMSPYHMFQNVLPSPCTQEMIDVSRIDEMFDKFVGYDRHNFIMTTSSIGGQQSTPGIVNQHAYSLIGLYNINGTKICKVRNPWGKTEYEGMYSESSSLWTPELQNAVGFKKGDDGVFFLTEIELQSTMPLITTSFYKDGYEYSWLQIFSKSNEDLYYAINVKKGGQVALKVTQQNERFRKDMQYENAGIRFEIWRLGDNYDAKIVSEGDEQAMYGKVSNLYSTQDYFEKLEPGRYMIRLKVMYDRTDPISTRGTLRKFIRGTDGKNPLIVKQGKCVLSAYGPQNYVFNKLTAQQAMKYLKNGYRKALKESGKTSSRLSTTDQDGKPTVVAMDLRMRNQIIYYAQNKMEKYGVNFAFKFDHKKFRNCSYGFNVDKETESCEWVLDPGAWNLMTLEVDVQYQEIATQGELNCPFKIIR